MHVCVYIRKFVIEVTIALMKALKHACEPYMAYVATYMDLCH